MGVTLVEVWDVVIIMSQVVIGGFSVRVLPIISRVTMSVNIFEGAEIVIIDWMMYFLKDFVVCQFPFLFVIATILSIKGMIKLRMHLMFEDQVMLFSFKFDIIKLLLWY